MSKSCEQCIWYDKCKSSEICVHYTPVDDDAYVEESEEEYEESLRVRHRAYRALVEEQDA